MQISPDGLDLVKAHEGLRLEAYLCPAGVWTIGYGTTRMDGRPVRRGDTITLAQAEELLRDDVSRFERAVNRLITVPLSQGQFDALVSFTYNLGEGALEGSTLRRVLNEGDYAGAAEQLDRWVNGGGKRLPGLVRRRAEERALFEASPIDDEPPEATQLDRIEAKLAAILAILEDRGRG